MEIKTYTDLEHHTYLKPKTLSMILAGGRVDELNVLTYYRPKSAVPIGGFARVIDFVLSNLMHSGLERVAILSQYRSFSLINHIGIGASWDMLGRYRGISILPPYIGYGQSHWYRGSADAVYQNLDFIQYHAPENVLILSGDHIYHMDYQEILHYHHEKDADLTVACLQVPLTEAHRFGVAAIDDEDGDRGGRIINYAEKPENPEFNWASLTVYCFKTKVLYEVLAANQREGKSFEFGRDIIPLMMRENRRVYGFKFSGYWGYTRTIAEYWQTSMDFLGPDPKVKCEDWGIRTNLEHRGIRDRQPLKVGSKAVIQDSIIYNGCVVDGRVEHSILFPGVHVQKGATVRDSVIFFNNTVKENVQLYKVVSDENNTFDNGVIAGEAAPATPTDADKGITVIGWSNHIPAGTIIGAGCTLYPHLKPENLPVKISAGEIVR